MLKARARRRDRDLDLLWQTHCFKVIEVIETL